jgi:hypothetical protein
VTGILTNIICGMVRTLWLDCTEFGPTGASLQGKT